MGQNGGVFELEHDELVGLVLKDIGHTLYEIYTVYFPHEVRATVGNKNSMPEDKA
jgi:hypothetical protein